MFHFDLYTTDFCEVVVDLRMSSEVSFSKSHVLISVALITMSQNYDRPHTLTRTVPPLMSATRKLYSALIKPLFTEEEDARFYLK